MAPLPKLYTLPKLHTLLFNLPTPFPLITIPYIAPLLYVVFTGAPVWLLFAVCYVHITISTPFCNLNFTFIIT